VLAAIDAWVLSTSISQIQVSNLWELRTKQHRNYLYPCLFCNAHLLKDSTTPQIRGTILHSIMELASQLSLLKIEEQTHSDRTSIISFSYSCCFTHPKSLYVKIERDKNRTRNQTQKRRKNTRLGGFSSTSSSSSSAFMCFTYLGFFVKAGLES
jgi:hypothetical protein